MATERKKVRGRKGKLGKNKHRIASYYASNRYEMNRLRRLRRHVMQYGSGDKSAAPAPAHHAVWHWRLVRDEGRCWVQGSAAAASVERNYLGIDSP